jgi:hypothetical protein
MQKYHVKEQHILDNIKLFYLMGESIVKYFLKMNVFIFTLYHAYNTKQVALKWVEIKL